MSKIAFLIEGLEHVEGSYNSTYRNREKYPEVDAAVRVAYDHRCDKFDSIKAFGNKAFVSRLFKEFPPELVTALLITKIEHMAPYANALETIILPSLRMAVQEGLPAPPWMNLLNANEANTFCDLVYEKYFHDNGSAVNAYFTELNEKAIKISNEMSKDELINYVKTHKDTEEIYAMVGASHLPLLDGIGKVTTQTDKMRDVILDVDEREVKVHLFGGHHGNREHFSAMMRAMETDHPGFLDTFPPSQYGAKEQSASPQRPTEDIKATGLTL